ncbi:MAG: acetyl-CoA carboxylase biotin carboxyl carrier protein, partial [Chitinophagaceae bacterium]|nr:acetyl-CoA carboxylase biotin carboxyl carrier protein [Chitinophagaceae bacterium]
MDFKQIQELIKLVNGSNIGEVTVEQKDFRVTIKQKEEHVAQLLSTPMQSSPAYAQLTQQAVQAQIPPPGQAPGESQELSPAPAERSTENTLTIKSPMIGTFYRKPAPDKPNFVEIGDEVSPGKVVCVIEAMKLFNEIESEVKGTIIKILLDDASPVEYDQP